MKEKIKEILEYFGFRISLVEKGMNNPFKPYRIPKKDWELIDNKYYIKQLDLYLSDANEAEKISYHFAKRIYNLLGGRFTNENGNLILTFNDLHFLINDAEELYIINEVFIEGHYNYLTAQEKYVLIDVGQNVGITSIYFAAKPNVSKVYGYELFPKTADCAKNNIDLNNLNNKVESTKVGLGKDDYELVLDYSTKWKARMGMTGTPDDINKDITKEKVIIKDVYKEFSKIFEIEKDKKIICKIDCEGAEYEILERLFEKNILGGIDVYMIEWHDIKKNDQMQKMFLNSNFHFIMKSFENLDTGMLYAFKNNLKG